MRYYAHEDFASYSMQRHKPIVHEEKEEDK